MEVIIEEHMELPQGETDIRENTQPSPVIYLKVDTVVIYWLVMYQRILG